MRVAIITGVIALSVSGCSFFKKKFSEARQAGDPIVELSCDKIKCPNASVVRKRKDGGVECSWLCASGQFIQHVFRKGPDGCWGYAETIQMPNPVCKKAAP